MSSGKYIVRQPIRDIQNNTIGNEILYYGDNQAFGGDSSGGINEFAAADTIYHFLTENTDKVLSGSLNFMTFTTTLLVKKTPRLFAKSELVIQIDDSVIIHPLAMRMVQQYAGEGYKIAVNEFRFAPRYLGQLDTIDYIKINFKATADASIRNIIEIAHSLNKKCIATEIDSDSIYQRAIRAGVDALQGPYVAEKMATKAHSSSYLKGNFFRLMVAVTREEPDVDEIERLVAMDVSLTYALLKVANSVYFALKHRATTIHQAVMTLGLNQLKQWVYLLGASDSGDIMEPGIEEFMKRSFLRATFCSDLMRYAKDMKVSKGDVYLMGMFSTLTALIDAPMEDILKEIPIIDEIKEALLHRTGRCGLLYNLILNYEQADWNAITSDAEQLGIPANLLTNIYFNCVEGVNSMWKQLTAPNPAHQTEEEEDQQVQLRPEELERGPALQEPPPAPVVPPPVSETAAKLQNRLSAADAAQPQAPSRPKRTSRLPKFLTRGNEPQAAYQPEVEAPPPVVKPEPVVIPEPEPVVVPEPEPVYVPEPEPAYAPEPSPFPSFADFNVSTEPDPFAGFAGMGDFSTPSGFPAQEESPAEWGTSPQEEPTREEEEIVVPSDFVF